MKSPLPGLRDYSARPGDAPRSWESCGRLRAVSRAGSFPGKPAIVHRQHPTDILPLSTASLPSNRLSPASFPGGFHSPPDKIGVNHWLLGQQWDDLAAHFPAFEEVGHVMSQHFHRLQLLRVLPDFVRSGPVHHVPIAGRDNRHLHQAKILVHLIPGGGCARPAGGNHGGRRF